MAAADAVNADAAPSISVTLVTGHVGSGKSSAVNALLEALPADAVPALVGARTPARESPRAPIRPQPLPLARCAPLQQNFSPPAAHRDAVPPPPQSITSPSRLVWKPHADLSAPCFYTTKSMARTSPPHAQPHAAAATHATAASDTVAAEAASAAAAERGADFGSGCLCCSPRGDFARLLWRLRDASEAARAEGRQPCSHLLVETTGLAEPAVFARMFFSDPAVASAFRRAAAPPGLRRPRTREPAGR